MSLVSTGARLQFEIALILISILPALTICYLFSAGLMSVHGLTMMNGWILAIMIVLVILGYVLLIKYPASIIRLRSYLENIVKGELPDKVVLSESGNDITAVECYLNVIVDQLKQRVDMAETEKDLLEKQLYQAQKLESIGTLAAGIAHEINTPIQFVSDNTRFLSDAVKDMLKLIDTCQNLLRSVDRDKGPELVQEALTVEKNVDLAFLKEEIPKAIAQSQEGLRSVTRIIRAMRDFSRVDSSEEKILTNINDVIESTITVSRNEWKYIADIKTDLDASLPPVLCFPGEVKQVLLNLIINASHAIAERSKVSSSVIGITTDAEDGGSKEERHRADKEKGVITFSTSRNDRWIEIRIHDTGMGIPKDIRDRIFDPFFTTREVGLGTGQGLAIAHTSVVRKHDGILTFETEVGKGTTFLIQLPLNNES